MDNVNSIAFIGGGAGAVELALALRKRFENKKSTFKNYHSHWRTRFIKIFF